MSNAAGRELLALLKFPLGKSESGWDTGNDFIQHCCSSMAAAAPTSGHSDFHSWMRTPPRNECGMGIDGLMGGIRRPIIKYDRNSLLEISELECCKRMPQDLADRLEELPLIKRIHPHPTFYNPHFYDPSPYLLGPTQLWDSELQQWVVMFNKSHY